MCMSLLNMEAIQFGNVFKIWDVPLVSYTHTSDILWLYQGLSFHIQDAVHANLSTIASSDAEQTNVILSLLRLLLWHYQYPNCSNIISFNSRSWTYTLLIWSEFTWCLKLQCVWLLICLFCEQMLYFSSYLYNFCSLYVSHCYTKITSLGGILSHFANWDFWFGGWNLNTPVPPASSEGSYHELPVSYPLLQLAWAYGTGKEGACTSCFCLWRKHTLHFPRT